MHAKFSFDSEAEPADMLRRARELGLSHCCITEHVDFDEGYPAFAAADVAAYRACVEPLVERFPGLTVGIGVEVAIKDAACAARTLAYIGGYEWDCIIGSAHNTDEGDPYEPEFFLGKDSRRAYRQYLETVAVRMRGCGYYHVLGHLDYGLKSAPYGVPLTYADAPDVFDEIFRYVIEKGITPEFNTSAQKDLGKPLWGLDYFKRYVELGGEAVCFGSDAHVPARIGYRFEEARALAAHAGIRYEAVYLRGERKLFAL